MLVLHVVLENITGRSRSCIFSVHEYKNQLLMIPNSIIFIPSTTHILHVSTCKNYALFWQPHLFNIDYPTQFFILLVRTVYVSMISMGNSKRALIRIVHNHEISWILPLRYTKLRCSFCGGHVFPVIRGIPPVTAAMGISSFCTKGTKSRITAAINAVNLSDVPQ